MSKDDPVSVRTDDALARTGQADMRPTYRALLRRLKESDPAGFAEATARYEEVLVPAIMEGADPVGAWTAYGTWIAKRLAPGRLVRLDSTGLASDMVDPAGAGTDDVLLHLPDAEREPAVPIIRPSDPSPAQISALQLLVR